LAPQGRPAPHCAELVIGRRFAPTRWLHAGYRPFEARAQERGTTIADDLITSAPIIGLAVDPDFPLSPIGGFFRASLLILATAIPAPAVLSRAHIDLSRL
jgi:hypothetical protein